MGGIYINQISTELSSITGNDFIEVEVLQPDSSYITQKFKPGTLSNQNSNAVAITGGNIAEIESLTAGSESNTTNFDSSGHQTMTGTATVFKDQLQSLLVQLKNNPADKLVINIAEGSLDFKDSSTTSDYAVMNIQINHDWKIGSEVFPHLHWFQSQSAVPNWLVQYRWQTNGGTKTTSWTNYPLTSNAFTYSSGTILQISYNSGITPPAGTGLSDILQLRLIRDTNNSSSEFSGNDSVSGNVPALNFDVHYEINSIGSNQEYVK